MSVQFARNQAEKLIERLDNPLNGSSVDVEYIAEEVGLKVIYLTLRGVRQGCQLTQS
jgi:Zn-finger domain-containing protein